MATLAAEFRAYRILSPTIRADHVFWSLRQSLRIEAEKTFPAPRYGVLQLFFYPQTKKPRLSRRNGVSFSSIDIPLLKVVRKKTFYFTLKILCPNYLKVNKKFQKNSIRELALDRFCFSTYTSKPYRVLGFSLLSWSPKTMTARERL
jgi:hypothetical protein